MPPNAVSMYAPPVATSNAPHIPQCATPAGTIWIVTDGKPPPAGLSVLLEVEVAVPEVPGAVRVAALDYSDAVPVPRGRPADDAECGRGLHLIDSVAKSWAARRARPLTAPVTRTASARPSGQSWSWPASARPARHRTRHRRKPSCPTTR